MVKAVNFWESSSSCICQKPEVRSKVVKMVELARPMLPMHSVISLIEYFVNVGVLVQLFEILNNPCFFVTQKMGEL
jgi:hypothetical protein